MAIDYRNGEPIWADLATSDLDRSRAFYGEIFGWVFESQGEEFGGYELISQDGAQVAGAMQDPTSPMDSWHVYLKTDDLRDTYARALDLGATPIMPPMQVNDLGSMALVVDPAGAVIGFWEPDEHPGTEVHNTHGAPAWHETHSKDFAKSLNFYTTLFGGRAKMLGDDEEFRYAQIEIDGDPVFGIMDVSLIAPEEMPSVWLVHYASDDVAATYRLAIKLGASEMMAPNKTPYGVNASLRDPNGAILNLVSSSD